MAQLKNTIIDDTGFLQLAKGTTLQRPASPSAGEIRFNTDFNSVEWWDNTYTRWFPAGVVAPVATGGTVTNITQNTVNYRVHTFTSVGTTTFTVTREGIFEYLIVGGGGGGCDTSGGGAGGVLIGQTVLPPGTYNMIVGAGTGNLADDSAPGESGSPSSAFGLVAVGGGGAGGGSSQARGISGGSGGGGGRNPGGSLFAIGAPGIPGQGNEGGTATPFLSADWEGGGGGGGGGPGHASVGLDWGGDGGPGVNTNITGTLQGFGGGAGGGSNALRGRGGLGGGGQGKLDGDATNNNGTANTGGGGGGGWSGVAGAGASGIIVVRYRTS
jgi:hypothetical protein